MMNAINKPEFKPFWKFDWHIRTSGLLDDCQRKEWIAYINNPNISYDDKQKRLSFFYNE
jgi:hypothetical protein